MGRLIGFVLERLERQSKRLTRKGLYEFLEREYARIGPDQEVLTVGAGGSINKLLGRHARERPFRVVSLDIDPSRGPDLVGDLCLHDFGGRRFDVAVLGEVLEHTHSPHLALANVREALVDGGRLILTTPFVFPIHNRPIDYYRFTRYGLEFLLREFEDVRVVERNSWAEAINVLQTRLYKEPGTAARLASPLFLLTAYLKLPMVWVLGRLIRTDFMTTGYVTTANRPARSTPDRTGGSG